MSEERGKWQGAGGKRTQETEGTVARSERALSASPRQDGHSGAITPAPVTGRTRALVIGVDRAVHWFARHWLAIVNILLAIYVGLPVLAPTLMHLGYTGPARAIYRLYSPMCHQFAYRSFFLYGEQPAYPRALAGTELTPFEAYLDEIPQFAGVNPENWITLSIESRRFLGNQQMGYKTALCERDMGIYAFVLVGGLVYGLLRKRMRIPPLSIPLFILVGMVPIALDGFSQLFGYYATPLPGMEAHPVQAFLGGIFPLRESPPLLRTFTGALFGLMLAWLVFPRVDEGMGETEEQLEGKLRRAGALD